MNKFIRISILLLFGVMAVSFSLPQKQVGKKYMGPNGGFFYTNAPGTRDARLSAYYYERNYIIDGVLHSDAEDLCETGKPETYYYLQVEPINVYAGEDDEFSESMRNVTRIQICGVPSLSKFVGKAIRVEGVLAYHIAGCHVHTDVYIPQATILD